MRLAGYDYAQPGGYFVTICTQHRQHHFGHVRDGEMVLNENGRFITQSWQSLSTHYAHVTLWEWIIMPNHLHGIVQIGETAVSPAPTLGQMMGYFKYQSTKGLNSLHQTPGHKWWQRGFYDHIIRNGEEWDRIRRYIVENPMRWDNDPDNVR